MGKRGKQEYLRAILKRYRLADKKEKRSILDEFCKVCDYNRKYAIRLLNRGEIQAGHRNNKPSGRHKKYDDPDLLEALKYVWGKLNLPCSKRLKVALPLWLPFYERLKHFHLTSEQRSLLLCISSATIDRPMVPMRARARKLGLCTTRRGSLLKKHIPIATDQWDEKRPGFIDADIVAHFGNSMEGMFVFTVNCIDNATVWRELRAIGGKGEYGVLGVIKDIEQNLPFPILGFDCDNGSEFINGPILKYFKNRKAPVHYTRSRPYHKNDNTHVEEKNSTLVRQYIGYPRLGKRNLADEHNQLYLSEWRLFMNFFVPSTKLIDKRRVGPKIGKKYDSPKTPFQRLLESTSISTPTEDQLQKLFSKRDPFTLQRQIQRKINVILTGAEPFPALNSNLEQIS